MSSPTFAAATATAAAADAATSSISDAKLAANRANAQHSRGPVTPEGKAKSSMNAVKTGLTGRTVLLPTEDAGTYQAHIERLFNKFAPYNDDERTLVQLIADTEWRLLRVASLESGFYAVGERKLPDDIFADETDPTCRHHLLQAEVLMTFRKDFANLGIQESRLNRQLDKCKAELQAMQLRRHTLHYQQINQTFQLAKEAHAQGKVFDPAEVGFDFTRQQFEFFVRRGSKQFNVTKTWPDFDKVMLEFQKLPKAA